MPELFPRKAMLETSILLLAVLKKGIEKGDQELLAAQDIIINSSIEESKVPSQPLEIHSKCPSPPIKKVIPEITPSPNLHPKCKN